MRSETLMSVSALMRRVCAQCGMCVPVHWCTCTRACVCVGMRMRACACVCSYFANCPVNTAYCSKASGLKQRSKK